ncbi:MAG: GCN5-related N-acetyltransferase, FIGfam019367 [uncultured Nocardioidaceae bacterium]|uniref:GCN5-related N-acetyltransferase, FIGfam019367 n=1 Tax=uncultured Nocardioidaceae bacterium TaxID=253824 RepID=A0A6J4MKK0_9ACTN|nr:MAG: GCN5-related N-acetyltransferase, FIGfam019367 [uncultured Nocardioidaceae bacterium]
MLRTQNGLRVLGPSDLPETLELLARDPVANVFADYRSRVTRLDPRWLGGEMWGYVEDGRLRSACHAAANLAPAEATRAAIAAFAAKGIQQRRRCSTIVGPVDAVAPLWQELSPHWSTPRECRWDQPLMQISRDPAVAPDPLVRRTTEADLEVLYPACVTMYTEEVGVSPEVGGGAQMYRARVSQLIAKGWSFARIEDGRVVFKAEVAAASPYACQIQGVWVDPERRGEGLAVAGMAAVVAMSLRDVAPVVSLYVNKHNVAARRAYEAVGFEQSGVFATIMF